MPTADALLQEALDAYGDAEDARVLELCTEALTLAPARPDGWTLLGMAHKRLGAEGAARAAYERAIGAMPAYTDAHNNLGNLHRDRGEHALAEAAYRGAIAAQPAAAAGWHNLGCLLHQGRGDAAGALAALDQAVALAPGNADIHWDRSLALLALGRIAEGFAEYEWRFARAQPPARSFPQPRWAGEALPGKTLLVYAEQGFGDTIQCLRFLPAALASGARVILEVQSALRSLVEDIPGVAQVVDRGAPLPAFDHHVPLISLPCVLGTTPATLPNRVPYLVPDAARIERFAHLIAPSPMLRVGLAWAGNPGVRNDAERSPRLPPLRALFDLPGVRFFFLQKGPGRDDLGQQQLPSGHVDLDAHISDFADTAAAMLNLDLVISSDTSVAHLAGALGVPLWVLGHHALDWRWCLQDSTHPWYPGARVFQQPEPGRWDLVVAQVRTQLERVARARSVPAAELPQRLSAAVAAFNAGDTLGALAGAEAVLDRDERLAEAWNLHGVALRRRGDATAAARSLARAVALRPDFPQSQYNLGNCKLQQGEVAGALEAYQACLRRDPDWAPAWSSLCEAFRLAGEPREAVAAGLRAVNLDPAAAEAHNNLGNAWHASTRPREAAACYRRALALDPSRQAFRRNLAVVLHAQGDAQGALECLEELLSHSPEDAELHWARALALLALGRLDDGFTEYEWRFRRGQPAARSFPCPRWDGRALAGARLLVHAEQGFGDTLQFLRFLPEAERRGATLILEVQPGLVDLVAAQPGKRTVLAQGAPLPAFEWEVPLLSLPQVLGTQLADLSDGSAYLEVPPAARQAWSARLGKSDGLRVGLVWGGRPDMPGDRARSPGLAPLLALLDIPGVRWYLLQKGPARSDLQGLDLAGRVVDLDGNINDFLDTAGALAQLDLVLSSDTSVAHLAGAVGKRLWLLGAFAPDWRWRIPPGARRPPWYPQARVFAQQAPGDWASVVEPVAAALAELAQAARRSP